MARTLHILERRFMAISRSKKTEGEVDGNSARADTMAAALMVGLESAKDLAESSVAMDWKKGERDTLVDRRLIASSASRWTLELLSRRHKTSISTISPRSALSFG